ncbi:tRNA-specific adenosine deaminase [bioreactor metagenome]|uniref:tRNA-specific adenosine deaminase n=1 Tax=bioreactor metagenome TaxID=1076179 RepID=A0A644X9N3_9ZZZZ
MELEKYMKIAIGEAEASLREGNNGFGTVIVKDGKLIASAHDKEDTESDPTSHAEINAIREASRKLGQKLSGCILISTHEPCPMCASTIVWAGITEVAYGYSIEEAIAQGRKRMDLPCVEIFSKANNAIQIYDGVLKNECSILYRDDVRKEIERLRGADDQKLKELNEDSIRRRIKWFQENRDRFDFISQDLLDSGYQLLLERFRISSDEAPVIHKTDKAIVFHSMNFCPTLEACRILDLDTQYICKKLNENSTDTLLKQIDKRLIFSRNYDKLRPYSEYCEESISLPEN